MKKISIISLAIAMFLAFSCGESSKQEKQSAKQKEQSSKQKERLAKQENLKSTGGYESINSGTITVYVDDAIFDFLQPVFRKYDSAYPDIESKFKRTSAREAMAKLLAGEANIILTPRDYLKDEDSLMKAHGVKPKPRDLYAKDALVFFVNKGNPIDSMGVETLKKTLLDKNFRLANEFPKLKKEPTFIVNSRLSSEYANLKQIVLEGEAPSSDNLKLLKNIRSVKDYIRKNKGNIGVGYLSQVINDNRFKFIKFSYYDSTRSYVFPHVVHQANIVRGFYPFIVKHYAYRFEERRDIAFWFSKFIGTEAVVQRYFLNSGIVPAYARVKLIER